MAHTIDGIVNVFFVCMLFSNKEQLEISFNLKSKNDIHIYTFGEEGQTNKYIKFHFQTFSMLENTAILFHEKKNTTINALYNLRPKKDWIRHTLLHRIALPHTKIASLIQSTCSLFFSLSSFSFSSFTNTYTRPRSHHSHTYTRVFVTLFVCP